MWLEKNLGERKNIAMSILKCELYKIFRNKSFWLLFAVVLLQGAFSCESELNWVMVNFSAAEKEAYDNYFDEFGGYLDADRCAEIEQLNSQIMASIKKKYTISADFLAGRITEEEYLSFVEANNILLEQESAFEEFYGSYLYAKETENKVLLNPNGFGILLSEKNINYVLLLFVILMAVVSVDMDEGSMRIMIACSYQGRRRTALAKYIANVLAVVCCVCAHELVRYVLVIAEGYSMKGLDADISCLLEYQSVGVSCSIGTALVISLALKLVGYAYMSCIALFLTTVSRDVAVGAAGSFLIVLLPGFCFGEDKSYYRLPLPSGMITGFPYLEYVNISSVLLVLLFVVVFAAVSICVYSYLIRRKVCQKND